MASSFAWGWRSCVERHESCKRADYFWFDTFGELLSKLNEEFAVATCHFKQ